MVKKAKLIAKTKAARIFLSRLFNSFRNWNGEWFVLNQATERRGEKGNWLLIAPVGHPLDKHERWIDASNDRHFSVLLNTTH